MIVAVESLLVADIVAIDDPEDSIEALSLLLDELVGGIGVPDEEIELRVLEICTSVVLKAVSDANEEVLLLVMMVSEALDELERATPVLISIEEEEEDSVSVVSTVVEVLEAGRE